jgi:hypothetical protein
MLSTSMIALRGRGRGRRKEEGRRRREEKRAGGLPSPTLSTSREWRDEERKGRRPLYSYGCSSLYII